METFNRGQEAVFLKWRDAHKDGYVLNCRTATDMMLHRPFCWHFGGFTEPVNLTNKTKVCSMSIAELKTWAFKTTGKEPKVCPDCDPH